MELEAEHVVVPHPCVGCGALACRAVVGGKQHGMRGVEESRRGMEKVGEEVVRRPIGASQKCTLDFSSPSSTWRKMRRRRRERGGELPYSAKLVGEIGGLNVPR